jgi:hypothetical protein
MYIYIYTYIGTANSSVTVEISVLDAALKTLLAIAKCGAIGIYAVLESVADGGDIYIYTYIYTYTYIYIYIYIYVKR